MKLVFLIFLFFVLGFTGGLFAQPDENIEEFLSRKCTDGNCKNGNGTLKVTFRFKGDDPRFISTYSGNFVNKKLEGKGTYKCFFNPPTDKTEPIATLIIEGNFKNGILTGDISITTNYCEKFEATVHNSSSGSIDSITTKFIKLSDSSIYKGKIVLDEFKPKYPITSFSLHNGWVSLKGVGELNLMEISKYTKYQRSCFTPTSDKWFGLCTMPNGDKINGWFNNKGLVSNTGSAYYADGDTLTLDFKGINGYYKFANGDKFVGEYHNWQRHGNGKFTFTDGTTEELVYENGIIVARKGDEQFPAYKKYYDDLRLEREAQSKAVFDKARNILNESNKKNGFVPVSQDIYTVTFLLVKTESSFVYGSKTTYSAVFVEIEDLTKIANEQSLLTIGKTSLNNHVDIGKYKIAKQFIDRKKASSVKTSIEKTITLSDFRILTAQINK